MQVQWTMLHPAARLEHLGLLPGMLDDELPERARDQFDACYQHGGGWRPVKGFILKDDNSIVYDEGSEDAEVYPPIAQAKLRDETILFYDCAWVAIVQPDRSFEVSRMD